MIIDAGAYCHRYSCLHPLFERAFRFLADADLRSFAPGRHAVDGDRMYLSIDHMQGRGRDAARLEAHRRYIDIQYTIDGDEEIGWLPLAECGPPAGGFDEARDIGFFDRRPATWLAVPMGSFAVFFPQDAHAPLSGRGAVKKAILKVAV
jgi:YhcH/YjgK/YiaL family protein